MIDFKWRTIIAGALYVHSEKGSDVFGSGTSANPFQSLRRAWESQVTKPTTIICYGFFSEDMGDGNHGCTIRGDYMGAATFDGADTYLIYGFSHSHLIITNCVEGNSSVVVASGSGLFAGAGRASYANNVGNALHVYGVAGSPVILDKTGVYWGVAGGISAVSYCVFSRLKNNTTYPISLGSQTADGGQHNTFYGVPIARRRKRITSTAFVIYTAIFAAWDMFADDAGITLQSCLIAADCKWYYNGVEIPVSGTTSEARQASLIAGMNTAGIPEINRMKFVSCLFSTQTATELFNNPEKIDFTLKLTSDGVIVPGVYYGALPPAVNIPILTNSSGVAASWDENSTAGCVVVQNDAICLDESSSELTGEVYSKIITINPTEINIDGIFANFASKYAGYQAKLNTFPEMGLSYTEGEILPIGRYIVKGTVVYNSNNIGDDGAVVVTATGTTFIDSGTGSQLMSIEDCNTPDVVYLRETPMPYVKINSGAGLQSGGMYLNLGNENITYRGRTIVPHESFVAENAVDTFTASAGYQIGVMFDDSRVPSVPWIPCSLWGEYFVWKTAGVINNDSKGIPISSGNYLSYQTSANGGYSASIIKSVMNKAYFQLRVTVKKYR